MGFSPSTDLRWILALSVPTISNRIISSLDWNSIANMERVSILTKISVANYFKSVSELSVGFSLADDGAVIIRLQSSAVEPNKIAQLLKWLRRRASWIVSLKLFYFVDCPSSKVKILDHSRELLREVLLAIKGCFRELRSFSVDARRFDPLVGMNLWMAMPNLENVEVGGMPAAGWRVAEELEDKGSELAVTKLIDELVGYGGVLRSVKVFRFVSLTSSLAEALDTSSKLTSLGVCRPLCPRPPTPLPSFSRITHLQLYGARLAYSEDDVRLLSGLSTLFPRLVHCELIEPWIALVPLAVRGYLLHKHSTAKQDRPASLIIVLTNADLASWSARLIPALKNLFSRRHRSFAISQHGDYRVVAKLRNASVALCANV